MSALIDDYRRKPSEWRLQDLHHHIDPGFINRRLLVSTFGAQYLQLYEQRARPTGDQMASLGNDHLLVDLALAIGRQLVLPPLALVLQAPKEGMIFCSTETLKGLKSLYSLLKSKKRIRNPVLLPYPSKYSAVLDFSGEHFVADTGKTEQSMQSMVSIMGVVRSVGPRQVIVYPMIMGAPTFAHWKNRHATSDRELNWFAWNWYETFPEDFDEFANCGDVPTTDPTWMQYMSTCPEARVKEAFSSLLAEPLRKDWGGEVADMFSSAVHLKGNRVSAAFLLKGPAAFREMTPDMLGKRADQIVRLASTSADLLVVQNNHTIGEAVRQTLRAFAVSPHRPRRYGLIDGRDTWRILKAYGLL